MNQQLAAFSREFHLKGFYSLVLNDSQEALNEDHAELLVRLAPFLRKFATTYINYFELKKQPPLKTGSSFENRLEEFYADLAIQGQEKGLHDTILWLLDQKATSERWFFPSRPVAKNYSDISRGLSLLDELLKHVGPLREDVLEKLLSYITGILSPEIDEEFDRLAMELLDGLQGFNARAEGIDSDSFRRLENQVMRLNEVIDLKLMSNNAYVSIGQQITEINKALKTVFKKDFHPVFDQDDRRLEHFWSGLKTVGYGGGDRYANGNYLDHLSQIHEWLDASFPEEKEALLGILDRRQKTPGLPVLAREPMPEAIQIHALQLLGTMGLFNDTAIRLALGFYSRFVGKMVRDTALQTLRRNASLVQGFFYRGLKQEVDYDQKRLIAEKHDSIFDEISAVSLVMAFGEAFEPVLQTLDHILENHGFFLNSFIKSAYLKSPAADKSQEDAGNEQPAHFQAVNDSLQGFKHFVDEQSPGVFIQLLDMWGLSVIVSWSLADYPNEKRLFEFIIQAAIDYEAPAANAKDQVIPLNNIIQLLTPEPDARNLIEKLMTFLLNSKISFDFPLFRSLFQVVAQRGIQLSGNIVIRDGFSEQRGYTSPAGLNREDIETVELLDPHIFQPIVVFLIAILKMKAINIPKDAFVETDISLYLNTLCSGTEKPRLGYEVYLANELIASIPYIVDFASKHEGIIRKTIADLDESYHRTNVLVHYLRLKIHRAPSKLDLAYCLEILEGLAGGDLDTLLHRLIGLMKGIGDEAIPDLEHYFEIYREKLLRLGRHLKALKAHYPVTPWHQIAEAADFEQQVIRLPNTDEESQRDIRSLVRLSSALSNYWTQRINEDFLRSVFINREKQEFDMADRYRKLEMIAVKRQHYSDIVNRYDPNMEPYQHIFLKRHVIQCDWNFDFFGFWPFYSETKFEAYNIDRKLALLERHHLEELEMELSELPLDSNPDSLETMQRLRIKVEALVRLMKHLSEEGLTPSKFFLDTIEILEFDPLSISQLSDIIQILLYRELSHIESFFANTFGHFPEKITKALGRENLDYGLDLLSADDEALLYPLVMETVLGNIIAGAHSVHLLERCLTGLDAEVLKLREVSPSHPVYPEGSRSLRALSPVDFGYKAYALMTLARDGFAVPALEVLPVRFFLNQPDILNEENQETFRLELIRLILRLEEKTGNCFAFQPDRLSSEEQRLVAERRAAWQRNPETAPPLLISARSGSYRSMPGILGTVVNIGYGDISDWPELCDSDLRIRLNTYRMFLSTLGSVVFGINEIEFSEIITSVKEALQKENPAINRWEDLQNSHILQIVQRFRELIEETAATLGLQDRPDWWDPLSLLADAVRGVWYSWDSEAAQNLRRFLGISDDWHTAVILMEMKLADRNDRSFSAILFSGDPLGKNDRPHGDVLFGRPGEDIAAGLASRGTALETLEDEDPLLYGQIVDLLEQVKINKGNIHVDVEMVGEYDTNADRMTLYIVQERQMPLGKRAESEDFRLTSTDDEPVARGTGVNGGAQHGVFLNGVGIDYYRLKEMVQSVRTRLGPKDEYHGPAIFLLMQYVTPEEALKMNIPGVDGIITTRIGKSSHASVAAKRDGKLFICEAAIRQRAEGWLIGGEPIVTADQDHPDTFTVVAYPKSVSPYSGNIYRGKMPMIKAP